MPVIQVTAEELRVMGEVKNIRCWLQIAEMHIKEMTNYPRLLHFPKNLKKGVLMSLTYIWFSLQQIAGPFVANLYIIA